MNLSYRGEKNSMKIRIEISRIIYTYLLSIITFYIFLKEMPLNIFLVIYAVSFLLVIIVLNNSSVVYKFKASILGLSICVGFLSVKRILGHTIFSIFNNLTIFRIILGIIIVGEYLYIIITFLYIWKKDHSDNKKPQQNMQQKIYDERQYDLERLERYIAKYNKVAVQGEWGCGKTYLVDEFIKKNAEKYEVIRIETLTCNLDSIDSYIFKQLETILWKNGIYPSYSKRIYDLLDKNSFLSDLKLSIYKDSIDRTTAFQGFCKDLNKLQKSVLLVCEDIDRISENYTNQIAKLLDIADRLSDNNVKVIYEYSQTKMTELGFEYNYMEKYVPYVINLTDIPFMKLITQALEEEEHLNGGLVNEDFRFLTYPMQINTYLPNFFKNNFVLQLGLNGIEPRKIKEFVNEVNLAMKFDVYLENKNITILYYYMKIFMCEILEELVFAKNVEEGLVFEVIKLNNGNRKKYYYNIIELANCIKNNHISSEEAEKIFCGNKNEKEEPYIIRNRNKLGIMILMGFNINLLISSYEENDKGKKKILRNSDLDKDNQSIRSMEKNLKINKLIKNLYMNGKSEYTDREAIAINFIDKVLLAVDGNNKDRWTEFMEDCYHSSIYKDNTTIFRFMGDEFLSLSQAVRVVINSPKYIDKATIIKEKFYQFWENHIGTNADITLERIHTFSALEPESTVDFQKAITLFNKLKVIGNMNTEYIYIEFLNTYLNIAFRLGYVSNNYCRYIKTFYSGEKDGILLIKEILEDVKRDIEKDFKMGLYPMSAKEEIMQFKQFLDKNIEIISTENKVVQPRIKVKETVSEDKMYVNEEVYNNLNSILKEKNFDKETYKNLLNKEYDEGNINISEYRILMNKNLEHL